MEALGLLSDQNFEPFYRTFLLLRVSNRYFFSLSLSSFLTSMAILKTAYYTSGLTGIVATLLFLPTPARFTLSNLSNDRPPNYERLIAVIYGKANCFDHLRL